MRGFSNVTTTLTRRGTLHVPQNRSLPLVGKANQAQPSLKGRAVAKGLWWIHMIRPVVFPKSGLFFMVNALSSLLFPK